MTSWQDIMIEAQHVLSLSEDDQYLGGQRLAELVVDTEQDEKLTAAFHVIYDVKDEYSNNDAIRVDAYNAIRALSSLMERLGYVIPNRHDGEGR